MTTTKLSATFEITNWDQSPSSDPEAGETMARATITKDWQGDLVGASVTDFLMAGVDDSGRAYVAQERFTGTLHGRTGTFVLHHGAAGGEGFEARQWAFVVPGTATGELAGLQGSGLLDHGVLDLEIELP